jgi:diguanylate cyclase (GGDEF)-like protein/PAS domain S-box-containing protein
VETTDGAPPVRVLLVDDVAGDRLLLRELLRDMTEPAVEVEEAASIAEMRAARARSTPDVYLLDYQLTDGVGVDAAREILASDVDAVVIMLTGASNADIDRDAEEAGVAGFLLKQGLDTVRLGRAIRYSLRHQRVRRALRESERRLERDARRLVDAQAIAQLGSWEWDIAANEVRWSDELSRIWGVPPSAEPISFREYSSRLHPDDAEDVRRTVQSALAERRSYVVEHRFLRGDGEIRLMLGRGEVVCDASGVPVAMRGTGQDITERRREENALREAQERFRKAFEEAPIGMTLTEMDGGFLQVNRAFCELTGYSEEQLLTMTMSAVTHPDDLNAERQAYDDLLAARLDSSSREQRIVHQGGDLVWTSVHATVVRDGNGPLHVIGQIQDITGRRQFEDQLQHMADHDPLTGLLNRRAFERQLEQHVVEARRYGSEGALLVLDLDQFKAVNDTLGHLAGDELIVAVAVHLRDGLRESDILARFGGDEFAVLVPRGGAAEARRVAAKLLERTRDANAMTGATIAREVTASIGIALIGAADLTGDELLVNADLAMYDAKEEGRDRYSLYEEGESTEPRIKARLTWLQRVEEALETDAFVLYAQPILDLRKDEIAHHELLIRMVTEDGDIIPPATFLEIAERFGLIGRIDRWVMLQAVRYLHQAKAGGTPLSLAVNLSGKTLGDSRFLPELEEAMAEYEVDPRCLTFELTETAAVANIHLARRFAQRLQDLGCRFALDDFGAGFGSFYYLKHLPLDYLKIDGEFVRNCTASRADQLIIKAVVDIAQGLGKETIAEFTEDDRTLQFLRRQGVDFAQGYHIGRPVPVGEILGTVASP